MNDRICMLCKEFNGSDNWVLSISDNKGRFDIEGHKACIDQQYAINKLDKDFSKKTVGQIRKEMKI